MAVALSAYPVAVQPPVSSLAPQKPPVILWGQGTPDGDAEPWLGAVKGSIYIQTDAADDAVFFYGKVDDAGEDADWKTLALSA